MNTCSLGFLLCCSVAALAFHTFHSRTARRIFLTLVNLACLGSFLPNPGSWVGVGCFVLVTYAALRQVRRRPSGTFVALSIVVVLAAFLVVKKYSFLDGLLPASVLRHAVVIVGLSYMLFKFIHMLVDEWQGQIKDYTLASYAAYQLSFFTLVAGPIQRYNDFDRFWEATDVEPQPSATYWAAWGRLLTGMIKMGGLAVLAWAAFERADSGPWDSGPWTSRLVHLAVYYYSYPIYLYFNFAGYTDVAIGSASLFGLSLPENFNRPYLARDIIDFWNRWHMTLTHWIRDYVFMSSYKVVAEHAPSWSRGAGYALICLSLVLAGAWHGATLNFLVFGAIHGVAAAINRAYADMLQRRLGRAGFQRYQSNPYFHAAAVVMTIHYVCFSLLFFSPDTHFAAAVRHAWRH
jgi:D-alanyl-lipoteichoic acid acyltransferase DltB (MBOAT superfamily)